MYVKAKTPTKRNKQMDKIINNPLRPLGYWYVYYVPGIYLDINGPLAFPYVQTTRHQPTWAHAVRSPASKTRRKNEGYL